MGEEKKYNISKFYSWTRIKIQYCPKVKRQTQNANFLYSKERIKNMGCRKYVLTLPHSQSVWRHFHVTNGHKCYSYYDDCGSKCNIFLSSQYYSQVKVIRWLYWEVQSHCDSHATVIWRDYCKITMIVVSWLSVLHSFCWT